ncbi:MAG: peptidoglycan DD-metalloendopeptidase family protein, partial [Ekhidna sp.]
TGSIYTSFHSKSAGWFTRIQSTVNGKTIITEYFHMQENNRVTSGNVLAGQIIGYQGDSGNLKGAIEKGMTVSHVHIKIKEHDGSHESDYLKNFDPVDPRAYLKTIINDDGASIKDSDC